MQLTYVDVALRHIFAIVQSKHLSTFLIPKKIYNIKKKKYYKILVSHLLIHILLDELKMSN